MLIFRAVRLSLAGLIWVFALSSLAHAISSRPTCREVAQLSDAGGPSAMIVQQYLIKDWRLADEAPAPGQGPIAAILIANMALYGTRVADLCRENDTQLFGNVAGLVYLRARIELFGALPQ